MCETVLTVKPVLAVKPVLTVKPVDGKASQVATMLGSPVMEHIRLRRGKGIISLRPPTRSVSPRDRQLVPSSDQRQLALLTPLGNNRGNLKLLKHKALKLEMEAYSAA